MEIEGIAEPRLKAKDVLARQSKLTGIPLHDYTGDPIEKIAIATGIILGREGYFYSTNIESSTLEIGHEVCQEFLSRQRYQAMTFVAAPSPDSDSFTTFSTSDIRSRWSMETLVDMGPFF
ncbi:hypothetical protein F66182_10896 [Fusarium sp. NRRL 66182]|nr:hypothetical protein F66182_10896 [Fusarium sp. NRRL 66182]